MDELVAYVKLKHGKSINIRKLKVIRKEKNLIAKIFWILTFGSSPTVAGLSLSVKDDTPMVIVDNQKLVTHLFDVYYTEKIKRIDEENKIIFTKYGRYYYH